MLLITGAKGQLGIELSNLLPEAVLTDADTLDITNKTAVDAFVKDNKIDVIVNCAAYTAVDKAEEDSILCAKINVEGPRILAATGVKIIHISTDYVFDGHGYKPYTETDTPNPLSVYGTTKLDGEKTVLENATEAIVIRTSWLYSSHGNNFVKTMRRLGGEKETLNVVSDQVGTPTYAGDLAKAIVQIIPQISKEKKGIYHFSNEGVCSWYDFAYDIMELLHLNCVVNPIPSSSYLVRAQRPFYSVLDKTKIKSVFGIEIPYWKESLQKCLKQF